MSRSRDYVGDGAVLQDRTASGALVTKYMEAPERIRAIGYASLDVLRSQPEVDLARIAAIGYCYGGAAVLGLARSGAEVARTVGFHSALATKRPGDAHQIKGKVLVCIGAEDPIVPPEQRLAFEQEMRAGKVDWRLYLFGNAVHGFANPEADRFNHPALAYHRPTDERSFRAMRDLFDETFGSLPRAAAPTSLNKSAGPCGDGLIGEGACRVAPGDCSPRALAGSGQGDFHHPALPLSWLVTTSPRFGP
jgi:dienelactone hydrolase